MDITRRDFLKISGAAGAGLLFGSLFDLRPIKAYAQSSSVDWDTLTISICCYCAVGCGLLVGSKTTPPYITYVQGDPDHPINLGTLCSKGQAMAQLRTVDGGLNPRRLTGIKYRAPYADDWDQEGGQDKLYSWDDVIRDGKTAIELIANRIKTMRDADLIHKETVDSNPDFIVNRLESIGCLGGAALDNEECYLLVKLMRALGLVHIEHQARI